MAVFEFTVVGLARGLGSHPAAAATDGPVARAEADTEPGSCRSTHLLPCFVGDLADFPHGKSTMTGDIVKIFNLFWRPNPSECGKASAINLPSFGVKKDPFFLGDDLEMVDEIGYWHRTKRVSQAHDRLNHPFWAIDHSYDPIFELKELTGRPESCDQISMISKGFSRKRTGPFFESRNLTMGF